MRRFLTVLGLAMASYAVYTALAPDVLQAQVVQVQVVRPYAPVPVYYSSPPVYLAPPPTVTYYAPSIAPAYSPSISAYPPTVTYSYYASPPAVVAPAPAPGFYTTRTYYGLGIFRPRGYYNETTYSPYP